MANKSRFVIAESKIKAYFKERTKKVYNIEELRGILEENRSIWNLPASMNGEKFAERLHKSEVLVLKTIILSNKKERFVTSDTSVFDVAVSLISKSYLSHSSAVFLHGLTNQISKIVYISFEQSKKVNVDRHLTQEAIDSAFSKPQRKSANSTVFEGFTFLLLNSMYSNRSGVYTLEGVPVTNIERTLIDITVRPNYAGGVHSVLDVYRRAIDKISMNKLVAILDKLNFIYPYHQSIGFYLERAGIENKRLDALRQMEKKFDFYLSYEMLEKEYSETWRVYYPKGI